MTLLSMSSRSSVDRAPSRCSGLFFFVPRSCHVDQFTFHISLPSLKFAIFINLSLLSMTLIALILAVCRTTVIYELCYMTLLSMSSHSSVDRAPAQCLGDHGFDSCQGLRLFFFVPCSCHVDQFTFHISLPS